MKTSLTASVRSYVNRKEVGLTRHYLDLAGFSATPIFAAGDRILFYAAFAPLTSAVYGTTATITTVALDDIIVCCDYYTHTCIFASF